MRNTFKLLFYIKKTALLRTGEAPVMGRITINGQRTQFSTGLSVAPEAWEVKRGCAAGRSTAAGRINDRLAGIRFRIEQCYYRIFHEHSFVTPVMVKELYFGIERGNESLLAFFRRHNDEFLRMVGVSRSKSTYYKYKCVCGHLEDYVRDKCRRDDIPFRELDRAFLAGFHAYISRECGHSKNTAWVYLIAFKHILMLARSKGYLKRDPFCSYRLHGEPVARRVLKTILTICKRIGAKRHRIATAPRIDLHISCYIVNFLIKLFGNDIPKSYHYS